MPDWDAIQREYEAGGISIRLLAAKCGVSKSVLHHRIQSWDRTGQDTKKNGTGQDGTQERRDIAPIHVLRPVPSPSPVNAVDIAQLGLKAILKIMKEDDEADVRWDLGELVKAANATTQFNRIIISAVPERNEDANGDTMTTIDTQDLSPERLARLKAFATEMREMREREGRG